MKKRKYGIRAFKCPHCGATMFAAKGKGKMTPNGHVKHMWCVQCLKDVGFVQTEIM